jgi:raffinose/stachyose/melibiose transport system permease protein
LGLINTVFNALHLESLSRDWLGDPRLVVFSLIIANIWQLTGLDMIIFYAGLQAIPTELYDAAKVDGASSLSIFKNITIPCLRETTIIVMVLMLTAAWKVFDIVWVVTRGGPANRGHVVGSWMYISAFRNLKHGYGSSISVFIFFVILMLSFIYIRFSKKSEIEF